MLRRVSPDCRDERSEFRDDLRLSIERCVDLVELSRSQLDDTVTEKDLAGVLHRRAEHECGHVLLLCCGCLADRRECFG
ncbi:hypothetical protein BJF88_11485 [Cellulosimicrobium sp. CUA-896]|nr:hypothetical protein BJF88_11485 [Cellulosimicrobium sp. CUA-896]